MPTLLWFNNFFSKNNIMSRPNTATKLVELLAQQHQQRHKKDLFKQGTFTIQWRTKVGSYPHPDLETMIPASEPDGTWRAEIECPRNLVRPEDKRNVAQNYDYFYKLPLNGYIPASAIRGLVRAWAAKRPEIKSEMEKLLGKQENDNIDAGKIQFLDAYPTQTQKVTLDIVNPQQGFQVYHDGQSTPLSLYTLGDGEEKITVTVAIRGIEGKATPEEVSEVWSWVEQALTLYGVGSRTASGYGAIKADSKPKLAQDPNHKVKTFNFTLYSQGCGGVTVQDIQLRPSHWRGWLRSWILRFLLGVMSKQDAEQTLGELMGSIDGNNNKAQKGCVRIEMIQGKTWCEESEDSPDFYIWKGKLQITAPTNILIQIILPIIKFAVTIGGVGRGWRRPLHIFNNGNYQSSRGCHLILTHKVPDKNTGKKTIKLFGLSPNQPELWQRNYTKWLTAVEEIWSNRINIAQNHNAEVFSPRHCAVYVVPYPDKEPIDMKYNTWRNFNNVTDTRGKGMDLIYQLAYKRQQDVGGSAAGGGNSYCSWVSIKRVNVPHPEKKDSRCQEVVCVFMGDIAVNHPHHLRAKFVKDLSIIQGARHLFGVQP